MEILYIKEKRDATAVIDDSFNTFLFKVDPLEHIKDAQTEM